MKNYEKYADEIKRYSDSQVLCDEIKIPFILEPIGKSCARDIDCDTCQTLTTLWLLEEYEEPKEPEEPEIDWSKVKVDTPILVRDAENTEWLKKHFAKYEDGIVYVWNLGRTSWTAPHNKSVSAWKYAKLAEDEKEPETDWSKVEVDTPILVRYSEKGMWIRRKFAKFENGIVYVWHGKETGHSKSYMTPWNYAKLAESERKDNISESNANN